MEILHRLRCNICGEAPELEMWLRYNQGQWECPACQNLAIVGGVADCRGARSVKEMGDRFRAIERLDIIVREARMYRSVLDVPGIMDAADVGVPGEDDTLWGAKIIPASPEGSLDVWDENLTRENAASISSAFDTAE